MKTVLAAFLALAMCISTFGQERKKDDATRSVSGSVTTGDTTLAVGAVVFLKNLKSLEVRSYITKDTGEYRFSGLSPDIDYELHAELKNQKSSTKTLSSFNSRKDAVINLKLPAAEPAKK